MIKMNIPSIVLIVTALCTALISGLLYAYSCSVNPGLGKLPDREYVMAMQSINSAIQNPVFFATFMGTLILLPLSAWLHYGSSCFLPLLVAAVIYIIGVFGVTALGNVPLNNALANFTLSNATPADFALQRKLFEQPWLLYHRIRTVASVIALLSVLIACVREPA